MDLGDPGWEPFSEMPPETVEPPKEPEPPPEQPSAPPQGATRMYEPQASAPASAPSQPDNSAQWAQYEPTAAMPPDDPFGPAPVRSGFAPAPPPGRMYGLYRQPPTWQHATVGGLDGTSTGEVIMASMLQHLAAIAAGAALGYFLTGHAKGAGGGALAVMGAVQLPFIFGTGGLFRAVLAAGGLGGAYWLLKDDSEFMRQRAMANWDYDENEGEDEPEEPAGASPSADPDAPAKSSPWLRPAT